MKITTLESLKDDLIGPVGSPEREQYEWELKMEILGDLIRQLRLERNLTQAALGALLGVQKAQISKLENNATNVSMGTLLSVLKALNAKAYLKVELPEDEFAITTSP